MAFARLAASLAAASVLLASTLAQGQSAPGAGESAKVDQFYGSFGTSVPIAVPAFHGIGPQLALSYSSTNGNGMVGVGWGLSGFSTIERASPGKGAPAYNSTDIFLLDNQPLIPCASGSSSPSCATGGTHSTEIENYQRIAFNAGANVWTLTQKDGTRVTYSPVYVVGPGTFRWGVSSVTDTRGNTVSYGWWCDPGADCYPNSVSYNGTVVTLYREARPDPITFANGSYVGQTSYRLKTIDVVVSGSRARAYRLTYSTSASTSRSVLASVQQFGRDATLDSSGTVVGGTALPALTLQTSSGALTFPGSAGWPTGGYNSIDRGSTVSQTAPRHRSHQIHGYHRGRAYHPVNPPPPPAPTSNQAEGGVAYADFNGDGITDIVWSMWECSGWYGAGCQAHNEIWLGTGTGYVPGPGWPTGGYLSIDADNTGHQQDGGVHLVDMNADGKTDIVWSMWECSGWYDPPGQATCQAHNEIWLSTGGGFTRGPAWPTGGYLSIDATGSATTPSSQRDGGVRLIDMNGDGITDVVWSMWECSGWYGAGCAAHNEIWLGTGSGFVPGPAWPTAGYISIDSDGTGNQKDGGVHLVDMNGDGKTDIVWSMWECSGWYDPPGQASCQAHNEIWLGTGSGFVRGPAWPTAGYISIDADNTGNQQDGGVRLVDINGDGKLDIVWSLWECSGWYGAGCAAHNEIWLGTGNGFVAGPAWPTGGYLSIDANGGSASSQRDGGVRLVDLNGDGKTDVVWSMWECSGWYGAGCAAHNEIWLGTGASFVPGPAWPTGGYFSIDADNTGNQQDGGVRLVDLNGDGTADVVWSMWECSGWYDPPGQANCQAHNEIHLSSAGTDAVTFVSNGIGGTTTISYKPSSAWPNTYLPEGMITQTAASLTTSDGRGSSSTTNYSYQGGLWSDAERRFLGFRKVTAVLDAAGNYTETYYHQGVGCISKPDTTYYRDASGNIYNYSSYGYTENASAPYTSLLTSRWDYECNQTSTCRQSLTQMGYDAFGNATTVYEYGDYSTTWEQHSTIRGYVPNTSAYIVGLKAYENVYAGIGTSGALLKQTLHAYDGATSYATAATVGNLTQQQVWNSTTGGYLTSNFGYDAYGNQTSATTPLGATSTTSFDSTYHAFVVQQCNALGQCTSRAWDAVIGLETSHTDTAGTATTTSYDALGRPVSESSAGRQIQISYLSFGDPNNQHTHQVVVDGTSDGQWTDTYFDGASRVFRATKKGGLTKDTVYSDASSRVWKQSAWYGAGEAPQYQVMAYDGAGRIRSVTNADGTSGTTSYGNGYVVMNDELGHEKVIWRDPYGNTTQIREKNGSSYYYTTYTLDPLGRVTKVTDANNNASTFSLDSLGSKVSECDVDVGCVSYTYDGGGNLLTQTNARGETIGYGYDALGRRVTRTFPNGAKIQWSFDESGHGASTGRLTSVVDPNGSESVVYDAVGRATQLTKCVSGTCYTTQQAYDAQDRLTSVTYPDGEVVGYTYDAAGRIASVGGYVTSFGYDARGHLLSAAYANGTTASFTYSATRQWLTSAQWTGPSGSTIYQASYAYDAAARVTGTSSTTDGTLNLSYGYDDLNRLTSVSGGQSQSFAYDPTGNVLSNSAVGSFAYGSTAHSHAVTAAGANGYTYDANGNMLTGAGGRSFTWTYDNQLASVTVPGLGTTTYAYDYSGQRVSKSGPNGSAAYFGKLVELQNGSLVKSYYAGPMLVAKRDASGAYFYHADHLGSIRLMTNAAGAVVNSYDYAAFGQTIGSNTTVANARGFGGHVADAESGLVYMNARYYDPYLGRFISADSIVPDAQNPQALNRYAFVYNNPVSNVDPTGHAPVVAAVVAIASVIAAPTAAVAIVAAVAAVTMVAGYVMHDPLLMSIGSILLNVAGGNWLGAAVSFATSPMSPLGSKVKQAIGWAYGAYSLVTGVNDFLKDQKQAVPVDGTLVKTNDAGTVNVYQADGKTIFVNTGVSTGSRGLLENLKKDWENFVANVRGELGPDARWVQSYMQSNNLSSGDVVFYGHSMGAWNGLSLAKNGVVSNVVASAMPLPALAQMQGGAPGNFQIFLGANDSISGMQSGAGLGASMVRGLPNVTVDVVQTGPYAIGAHFWSAFPACAQAPCR